METPKQAHGIGIPASAVRGTLRTKEALRRRINYWERTRHLVETQMPGKGFTETEVQAALERCDVMLNFYDDALEPLE